MRANPVTRGADAEAITHFVRKHLGCTCPDEVFEQIEWRHQRLPASGVQLLSLAIGGRLLVEVVALTDLREIEREVEILLRRGQEQRDSEGFNRYRLVLLLESGATPPPVALASELPERIHLHWLAKSAADALPPAPIRYSS